MLVDELRLGYQFTLLHCLLPNAAFTPVIPDTSHIRLDKDHSSSDGWTDHSIGPSKNSARLGCQLI